MLFNSFEYVLFLSLVFVGFWALVRTRLLRVLLLLVASYAFYMSWNATYIVLIVFSTVIDYLVGLGFGATECERRRKGLLLVSLLTNLGLLGVFKYYDFGAQAVADILGSVGIAHEPRFLHLVLPVGISFYTFQTLSYTIDVYRRQLAPTRSFLEFATFVSFFPQLVAGPIVRARELLPQFDRTPNLTKGAAGAALFLLMKGMVKKVLVADYLAVNYVDRIFENPGIFSSAEVMMGLVAYGAQIYCDFSGYTDIALGSAGLIGFQLPENFNRPYAATGPIDFWRRWHITLSTWVRDYIYVPLGGSRRGPVRGYFNTFIAFLIMGIWHGAGWTYVCFGLYHATSVALNRWWRDRRGDVPDATGPKRAALIALHLTCFTLHWPLFRAPDVDRMMEAYAQIGRFSALPFRVPWPVLGIVLATYIAHYTKIEWRENLARWFESQPAVVKAGLVSGLSAIMLYVGAREASPFIFFQF